MWLMRAPSLPDLFDQPAAAADGDWPAAERFPLNHGRVTAGATIVADLLTSPNPLIVTGYAALDRLIDLIAGLVTAKWEGEKPAGAPRLRLLIGAEPYPAARRRYPLGGELPAEIAAYWLKRGISLAHGAKLVLAIEHLRHGRVEVRYGGTAERRLHAKIYLGEHAVTLGSSNFSAAGLSRHFEANARFSRRRESARYREAAMIAERFWEQGRPYCEGLIALLTRLLRTCDWREALAFAVREILEGGFVEPFLKSDFAGSRPDLWPSQRQGIAQALYILANQGSVLIADATGSGKTRMGVHLAGAKLQEIIAGNRLRRGRSLLVCPPAVRDTWLRESLNAGVGLDIHSHGSLSSRRARGHEMTVERLRRAQLLMVDEGHNFLNLNSQRTQQLLRNMADHVVLFTATPINRGAGDLLRIADMLGADNLESSALRSFSRLLGRRTATHVLGDDERDILRHEIARFTVRRTKSMLNRMIDRDPESYTDAAGRQCRFPRHKAHPYPLGEPAADRRLAARIRALAGDLKAVTHFRQTVRLPPSLARRGVNPERYLAARLLSARRLAQYMVMRALRSSRAALVEHLAGTAAAAAEYHLGHWRKTAATGDMIGQLPELAGRPPEWRLAAAAPDWLSDPEAHRAACAADLEIYREILDLVRRMSPAREQAKCRLLEKLVAAHGLVLAFDSRPITLAVLRTLLHAPSGCEVLIASGEGGAERRAVLDHFAPTSRRKGVIALCSDSLAEGVNLQAAKVMVHLDMPSVVRIAEQRVGRVDRLDSPHGEIEAWWPDDAAEFALSSDEHFIERYETVEHLLGSNMPLPETLAAERTEVTTLTAGEQIAAFEKAQQLPPWDGIEDAFQPVRGLIEGPETLLAAGEYTAFCRRCDLPRTMISLLATPESWGLFCMRGSYDVPRWILLPGLTAEPLTDFASIAAELRRHLVVDPECAVLNEQSERRLNAYLIRLAALERALLPRRKQRALDELERAVETWMNNAAAEKRARAVNRYHRLLNALRRRPAAGWLPDWDEIATRWLDIIRPLWYERLAGKHHRPLLLRDIRRDLAAGEERLGQELKAALLDDFPRQQPTGERIIAALIGVGR